MTQGTRRLLKEDRHSIQKSLNLNDALKNPNDLAVLSEESTQVKLHTTAAIGLDPLVRSVQRERVRVGEMSGGAGGVTGSHTRAAISHSEAASTLPVDGDVSQRLLATLRATQTQAAAPGWIAPVASSAAQPSQPAASQGSWVQPVTCQ